MPAVCASCPVLRIILIFTSFHGLAIHQPHFFGEIVRSEQGRSFLERSQAVSQLSWIIREYCNDPGGYDLLDVKAALWALVGLKGVRPNFS